MPAIASLKELHEVNDALAALKNEFPEAYERFDNLFRKYRKIGYRNICKLLLGESTPEKLKGSEEQ